jgi:hypothetical protein
MEYLVTWNEESYGDTETQIVTMAEFKADGIGVTGVLMRMVISPSNI